MGVSTQMQGARLPYVVRKIEGKVSVTRYKFNRRDGKIEPYEAEEDAGYLVMFPRGHYLRIRTKEDLIAKGLHRKPKPIADDGTALHPSQSPEAAFETLEANVADFVRRTSGPITVSNLKTGGKVSLPVRPQEESYV